MASWHTVDSAQDEWPDAPVDDDGGTDQLADLLAAAKDAVLAYAPDSDAAAPAEYTATSVEPDVATLTLTPSGGLVSASVDIPGAGAFNDEVLFAIPAAYVPAAYVSATSRDARVNVYTSEGSIATLRVLAAAGDPATLSLAWAPVTPFGDVPVGWRLAQLKQAQNIWNASKASPTGDFDGGQYGLSTFPLDWAVRQLIRPKRGKPVIG